MAVGPRSGFYLDHLASVRGHMRKRAAARTRRPAARAALPLRRTRVPAFGGYRATHAMCMLATFQVEGSAPLRGADLSSCK